MAIQPNDLKLLADELASQGGECKYRSAISRTYYSAYHYCLAELGTKQRATIENVIASTHAALISWYMDGTGAKTTVQTRNSRELAYTLNQLRALRRTADYFLQAPVTKTDVTQCGSHWCIIVDLLPKSVDSAMKS